MLTPRLFKFRFSLISVFVLVLGIAIGFTLKTVSLWHWFDPPNKANLASIPTYVIEPPDIPTIAIRSKSPDGPPTAPSQNLVGPDGNVNFGVFGQVYVAGLTLKQARTAVEKHLSQYLDTPTAAIDVFAYNSKFCYLITRGGASGDQVTQLAITGNETALDGIAQLGGLKLANSSTVWIARPAPNGLGSERILPIKLDRIFQGVADTNHQLLPRDRLYISPDAASAAEN
jgi:polysaccharide biosynthesis/export protein